MSVIQVLIRRSGAAAAVACLLCSGAFAAAAGGARDSRGCGSECAADRMRPPLIGPGFGAEDRPPPYLMGIAFERGSRRQGVRHHPRSCPGDARTLQGGAKAREGLREMGQSAAVRRRESGFAGAVAGSCRKPARVAACTIRSRDLLLADARAAHAHGRRAARRSASRGGRPDARRGWASAALTPAAEELAAERPRARR